MWVRLPQIIGGRRRGTSPRFQSNNKIHPKIYNARSNQNPSKNIWPVYPVLCSIQPRSTQRYMSSLNNAQSDHIQPFQGSDPSKLWLRNSPSVLRPRPYLGRAIQHAGKRQAKVEVFFWIDVIQSLIIWHRAACLNCKVDSYDSKLLKGLPFVAGFGLQVLLLPLR